jgi:tight adherence protein C
MSSRLRAAFAAAIAAVVLMSGTAIADDPIRIVISRVDAGDFPTVRLVASVVDASGKPVRGLRAEDLQLRERNLPTTAKVTLATLVSPVALALVVDTSGSMSGRPLADAKAAMATMISALGPNDQVAVVAFNATVRTVQPLTSDKARALAAIGSIAAGGDTAIYDAVIGAVQVLDGADSKVRRAIVLLTDGLDTASRNTSALAVGRIATGGVPLYAVGLGDNLDRSALQDLSQASPGGAAYVAPTSAQLTGLYAALAEQILTEYSVEYHSGATTLPDGAIVPFELSVSRGGVVARAASSFTIPQGRGAPAAPVATAPAPKEVTPDVAVIEGESSNTMVVSLLGAMTALMFVLWLNELTLYVGSGQRRRVIALIRDAVVEPEEPTRPSLLRRLARPLRGLGGPILRALPAAVLHQTRRRLELAGAPISEAEFIGIRVASMVVLGFVFALVVFLFGRSTAFGLIGAGLGLAAGFAIPGFVLGSMARKRKSAIRRALVPSLDMLALSADAGLAFDGAIAQVVLRWKNPLSDELRRLLLEFQMGRDRRQALRELARRTDLPDVGRFVNAVIQADTLGVGLAKVLQDQALELRTKRRQRAEELARLAPVKMMFPMVLLIFPALFLVILGPAVPKMTAIFNLH